MKKLVTHNGKFHTDDVLAAAILSIYLKQKGESFEFIRTRDEAVIDSGDIVFDIGNSYDPTKNRFDHHQKGRAGERENGIPYAACGLVWRQFGLELCSNENVWLSVDQRLVQAIDASDNGISTETLIFEGVKKFSFGSVIDCYLPVEDEASLVDFDKGFLKAVEFAEFVLDSTVKKYERVELNKITAKKIYQSSDDKRIVICEKYIPGISRLLGDFSEPLFVIYPDQNNHWRIDAVRDSSEAYVNRMDLPKEWGGLRDEEFQKVSGVFDATFCHPGLFTAGAVSKEGQCNLPKSHFQCKVYLSWHSSTKYKFMPRQAAAATAWCVGVRKNQSLCQVRAAATAAAAAMCMQPQYRILRFWTTTATRKNSPQPMVNPDPISGNRVPTARI